MEWFTFLRQVQIRSKKIHALHGTGRIGSCLVLLRSALIFPRQFPLVTVSPRQNLKQIFFRQKFFSWIFSETEFCRGLHTAVVFRMQSFNLFMYKFSFVSKSCYLLVYTYLDWDVFGALKSFLSHVVERYAGYEKGKKIGNRNAKEQGKIRILPCDPQP